jgi:hypothetical protein
MKKKSEKKKPLKTAYQIYHSEGKAKKKIEKFFYRVKTPG